MAPRSAARRPADPPGDHSRGCALGVTLWKQCAPLAAGATRHGSRAASKRCKKSAASSSPPSPRPTMPRHPQRDPASARRRTDRRAHRRASRTAPRFRSALSANGQAAGTVEPTRTTPTPSGNLPPLATGPHHTMTGWTHNFCPHHACTCRDRAPASAQARRRVCSTSSVRSSSHSCRPISRPVSVSSKR